MVILKRSTGSRSGVAGYGARPGYKSARRRQLGIHRPRKFIARHLRAPCQRFGRQLHLRQSTEGGRQTTNYAGDIVSDLQQLCVAEGHAAVAATAIHNSLPPEFSMMLELTRTTRKSRLSRRRKIQSASLASAKAVERSDPILVATSPRMDALSSAAPSTPCSLMTRLDIAASIASITRAVAV